MPLDVAEGTYQIVDPIGSDLEAYTAEYDSASDNLYLDAISGTIEITTLTDDYIEGTFYTVKIGKIRPDLHNKLIYETF